MRRGGKQSIDSSAPRPEIKVDCLGGEGTDCVAEEKERFFFIHHSPRAVSDARRRSSAGERRAVALSSLLSPTGCGCGLKGGKKGRQTSIPPANIRSLHLHPKGNPAEKELYLSGVEQRLSF